MFIVFMATPHRRMRCRYEGDEKDTRAKHPKCHGAIFAVVCPVGVLLVITPPTEKTFATGFEEVGSAKNHEASPTSVDNIYSGVLHKLRRSCTQDSVHTGDGYFVQTGTAGAPMVQGTRLHLSFHYDLSGHDHTEFTLHHQARSAATRRRQSPRAEQKTRCLCPMPRVICD